MGGAQHTSTHLVCTNIQAAITAQKTAAIKTHGVAGIGVANSLTAGLGCMAHAAAAVVGQRTQIGIDVAPVGGVVSAAAAVVAKNIIAAAVQRIRDVGAAGAGGIGRNNGVAEIQRATVKNAAALGGGAIGGDGGVVEGGGAGVI